MKLTEEVRRKLAHEANTSDFPRYLESRGYSLKRKRGIGESYEIEGTYITISKGARNQTEKDIWEYYDFSSENGGNAIEFLVYEEGLDWIIAIEMLTGKKLDFISHQDYKIAQKKVAQTQKKEQQQKYNYPKNIISHDELIYEYLSKSRKLNPKLVKYLIEKKWVEVMEKDDNGYTRLVFPSVENGKIVGHQIHDAECPKYRKIVGYKKYRQPHGRTEVGFNIAIGKPKSIIFFESVVDLLSYWELQKPTDVLLVSMNGLKASVVEYYANKYKGLDLILAPNNDDKKPKEKKRADMFVERNFPNLKRIKSKNEDWNDDLKELKSRG